MSASLVTCFAPERDCVGIGVDAVDAAGPEILINANGPPDFSRPPPRAPLFFPYVSRRQMQ
jgi:hypothetical protein